jgi:hypothetical protein
MEPRALFVWLISHQPAVLFSQNKPATSNQPAVLFSQSKSAPAISHQPNEQAARRSKLNASFLKVPYKQVLYTWFHAKLGLRAINR